MADGRGVNFSVDGGMQRSADVAQALLQGKPLGAGGADGVLSAHGIVKVERDCAMG